MLDKYRLRRSRGFSLLESMVSMAILALLGVTLLALIVHTIRGWSSGTSRTTADNAASVAVHKLCQDVRVGKSACVSNGELLVTVPPLVTDAYGEQQYDTSAPGTVYRYYVSNGALYRQVGAGTATVFARYISSATFSASGRLVTVLLTSTSQVGASETQRSCSSSAGIVMRNCGT